MKKIEKLSWEEIDKSKWQRDGYGQCGNIVARKILHEFNQTVFAVYFIIQSHRHTKNNKCFPSIQTIADECGFSKSTVEKAITVLEKAGYLSINSGRQGVNNNYYFPQESFYEDQFGDDINQQMAYRRSTPGFKKKNKQDNNDTASPVFEDIEEDIF